LAFIHELLWGCGDGLQPNGMDFDAVLCTISAALQNQSHGIPVLRRSASFRAIHVHWPIVKNTKRTMKNRTADFFVSYSSPDLRTARQFVDWIGKAGMTALLIEPGEGGGKSFPTAMSEAIERCDRLLAVYTQHYKNSGACTAEMEGMWRRDPDGKLGRIIIVRLDATEVPALFATRDYWDFTKIPVEDVKEESLRRLHALKPIRPRRKSSKAQMESSRAPHPVPTGTERITPPGMNLNISGSGHQVKQAGRDIHETHYHSPKPPKVILQRRGDEISNAQTSEIRQKLGDWGTALWESTTRKAGKSERAMHQQVQERFKKRLNIPRYDALEADRFDEALAYIRTEMAKLRPKLAKTQPSKARNALLGSIKQAMKAMGQTKESYYPELARRLKLSPFGSLTQLPAKDLERACRMARNDARK
jgi:hypothetical protein